MHSHIGAIATRLLDAHASATLIAPITATERDFEVAAAYDVLREIDQRRVAQGWVRVGRKIGFTNRTLWARYGVYQPMWAHIWAQTVHFATAGVATLELKGFAQPRIEPEVVFKLAGAVPATDDPLAVLACVEWLAPGFEIVQCHFPGWKFEAADCTAAFGLHGALVVGPAVALTEHNRAQIAAALPTFALTLRRGGEVIDVGVGANVLDSPALALVYLARVLAGQSQFPALAASEVITTGTLTDAWPVAPGQTWTSDYGTLPVAGMTLTFT